MLLQSYQHQRLNTQKRRVLKEMRLSIGLAGWQVHQLVREAMGCATTGVKQVRHRGFDKCICAAACAEKGSSSRHLTVGSFCPDQWIQTQYLNKEGSPAGKATRIKAPKLE